MVDQIGQISFYLAKEGNDFDSIIDKEKLEPESDNFKTRSFEIDSAQVVFICFQKFSRKSKNAPWIDFVNEQLEESERIDFPTKSVWSNGVLLIRIEESILAATFGQSGASLIDKTKFHYDFGIRTAMNMCGNEELRQTKSSTHSIRTQNIDRQLSQPSDTNEFRLGEVEILKYISAHMKADRKVTLQGKDSLTVKVIGDEKITWENIIDFGNQFILNFQSSDFKDKFPNYPNLEDVSKEKSDELDALLIEKLTSHDFEVSHLAIPEFLQDDEFSFSYTDNAKKENKVYSHLDISQLIELDIQDKDISFLKRKKVFAYSPKQDRILSHKKWKLYNCIVSEIEDKGECYILSDGNWRKVDSDFYDSVNIC